MRLLIVRHAETHSNVVQRFQGSGKGAGSALTTRGQEQARALAEYLSKRMTIDTIYSSPAKRTLETAEILRGAFHSPIKIYGELREINCGDWEGRASELIQQTYPEKWEMWQSRPLEFRFPNGESLLDVQARIKPLLSKLIEQSEGKTLLLLSHSATISVTLAYLHKWALEEAWCAGRGYHRNTAFSTLKFHEGTGELTSSEIASLAHLSINDLGVKVTAS